MRFAQIGAVTGFVIGHFVGMYRARKCKSSLMTTSALLSAKKAKHWMLGSIVISVPVSYGYFRIRQYEYNDFYDRAYRLRGNRYQNRIDRASILGALCGGLLMLKRKRFCDGIALGMVNGLLLMILCIKCLGLQKGAGDVVGEHTVRDISCIYVQLSFLFVTTPRGAEKGTP